MTSFFRQSLITSLLHRPPVHFVFIIILTIGFCFLHLGDFPLHEWDETRNGVNAIEMLQNGEWLTLHYAGAPDNWSFKPPLFIWLTALSFQLFGFSTFALRFFPALFAWFSLLLFWRIIQRYHGVWLASLTVSVFESEKILRSAIILGEEEEFYLLKIE